MAEVTPITIRLDEQELKDQVTKVVSKALEEVSMKFRMAADNLNPEFLEWQDNWIESEIERRVEAKLKEAEK